MNNPHDFYVPDETDRQLIPELHEHAVFTNPEIIEVINDIKQFKEEEKLIKKEMEKLKTKLNSHMKERELLVDKDTGEIILTWRHTADRMVFDEKRFKVDCPTVYESYLKVQHGHKMLVFRGE